jgi:hypothetical protein
MRPALIKGKTPLRAVMECAVTLPYQPDNDPPMEIVILIAMVAIGVGALLAIYSGPRV